MKELTFVKMQGAGNDYIYIDCLDKQIELTSQEITRLSNRNFGIGSDGVVLIESSTKGDAFMRMHNADGSEGRMCGNAIRCVAKYLFDSGRVKNKAMRVETLSGVKSIELIVENGEAVGASVDMGQAELKAPLIPCNFSTNTIINHSAEFGGKSYYITCVSMGNPHCVVFCNNLDSLDIIKEGSAFEKSPHFPQGINTEFVQVLGKNHIKMRVFERGSGETLACGTGACAAAVAAVLNGFCQKGEQIRVDLLGGTLSIEYSDERVLMSGAATKVFEGKIKI